MTEWDPMRPTVDPFGPQARIREAGGLTEIRDGFWIATRYDLVREGMRQPQCLGNGHPGGQPTDSLLHLDGPRHLQLRRLIGRGFRPRALEGVDQRVEVAAHSLIDAVVGAGAVDLVPALTRPLPAIVFCDLLGIPAGDRDRFLRWSDDRIAHSFSPAPAPTEPDFVAYVQAQIDRARAEPGNTLLHHLIDDTDGEGQVTDAQLKAAIKLLIVAGNETTANLLATLFHQLLVDRTRWEHLRADRSLIPGVVEEALRFDPPLNWVPRQARSTCQLGGQAVPAGATVAMGLGAANRDPAVFERADQFDIERTDVLTRHFAFGHGEHFCLGAGLARIEARATLAVALDRLPGLRLADDFEFEPKGPVMMRGAKRLPVTF